MSEKAKVDLKTITASLQGLIQRARHYSLALFLLLVFVLYGFLMYRINLLSQAQPSSATVSQTGGAHSLRVDQNVIHQLQSLQDNSVSVKTLFNDARSNPFQ
jgi:hypothetical protein